MINKASIRAIPVTRKKLSFQLKSIWDAIILGFFNLLKRQTLRRVPEPEMITTDRNCVEEYSQTANSSLSMIYGLSLEYISRLMPNGQSKNVLELACGPGIFSQQLAKHIRPDELIGLDLSDEMLGKAREHNQSNQEAKTKLYFRSQDIRDLSQFSDNSFDLVCFMDAAHHMPHINDVTQVLKEADRVCNSDGLIFLIDPVRPKTEDLLNKYSRIIKDLNGKSFKFHSIEFYNSLKAAWTLKELHQAVPTSTKRNWVQIYPHGFKAAQIVMGIPESKSKLLSKYSKSHIPSREIIPRQFEFQWNMFKIMFKFAHLSSIKSSKVKGV